MRPVKTSVAARQASKILFLSRPLSPTGRTVKGLVIMLMMRAIMILFINLLVKFAKFEPEKLWSML